MYRSQRRHVLYNSCLRQCYPSGIDRAQVVLSENGGSQIVDATALEILIDNEEVLELESAERLFFRAIAVGETTVRVRLGELESNAITVRVMEAEVTIRMLTISAMTTEADVGDGLQLVAIGITSADTEVDLTNEVTWLSSDSDVTSVDQATGCHRGFRQCDHHDSFQ